MVHIYIYVQVDISKIYKTNINKNLTLNIRYMGGCIVKKKIMDISVITSKKSHFFNEKCIICWDKLPRHIYIPCGHFGVCTDCKKDAILLCEIRNGLAKHLKRTFRNCFIED